MAILVLAFIYVNVVSAMETVFPEDQPMCEKLWGIMATDAPGKMIHVVLQVTDDGAPPLTRYRRAVLTGVKGH